MRSKDQKYLLTRLMVAIALVAVLSPVMAQRTLNSPLTASLTVQDGTGIILAPGFSTNGFNFQASIGVPYVDVTPSSDKNYIISTTYNAATTSGVVTQASDLHREVQYFDGLGRPMQKVSMQASPNGKDIVTPIHYDDFGREDKKYLPYALAGDNNGAFVSADVEGQSSFYSMLINTIDGPNAFAKTDFEHSPLNRVVRQGAPGLVWQPDAVAANDHSVKLAYGSNSAADNVQMWTISSGGSPTSTTTYPVNSLYKTTTWDENNPNDLATTTSRTEEFKDLQGKVVLKRSYKGSITGSETLSTYYIYDDFELLRVVIPPLANGDGGSVATVLNDLCYQYTYDARKRMTIKKIPGADPVYMVYDLRDRLVATQDGVQRGKDPDEWTFTKYDALNRSIMTGIYKVADGTTPETVQATVSGFSVYSEDRLTTGYGYTNNSFPIQTGTTPANISESDLLTVLYYDTYGYPGVRLFSNDNNVSDYHNNATGYYYFDQTKGQVTGSRVKVLDGTENNASGYRWLVSSNYYDDRYRVIQTPRDLFSTAGNFYEVSSTLYDFIGKVMKTRTLQLFYGVTNIVTESNTYDNAGRLKQVKHQVNSGTEVTLASMEYDEVGQLKQKSLNGEVGSGIQNLNYSYNIRGWLEKINNPDVNPSASSTQKLNLGLNYNNVPSGLSANAQFNGNISGLVWNTPEQSGALSPADKQGYGFTYDGLNRMRTSTYGEGATFATNSGANNENVDYDKNGNITFLTRYRKGTGLIDNLSYTYKNGNASNMLDQVDDAVAGAEGFSEYVKQANEYAFDGNGNLIKDDNKAYNSILYNYLNLPKRVGTTSQYISYVYDAAGTKLAKINTGGVYTYYAGSFVYSGSSLNYIIHSEGMYLPGGNYQYYLKDHLGNTRLVVNTSGVGGTIVQQTDFYPFGMDIANYNSGVENKYRYNGKEFQNDLINGKNLDWYDYGARFYDPVIGRWHTADPSSEKGDQESLTLYQYGLNNPIRYDDPDGRCPSCIIGGVVGAAVDYGEQVATNYIEDKPNPWTDNINLTSIGTAAVAGFVTSGGSIVESVGAKITVKAVASVINNTVELNTTSGITVHTNVVNIVKNAAIDLAADGVGGKVGGKVEGAMSKVGVTNAGRLSSTARAVVSTVGQNVTRSTTASVKAGLKVATKVVAQTVESTVKVGTNKPVAKVKEITNQ